MQKFRDKMLEHFYYLTSQGWLNPKNIHDVLAITPSYFLMHSLYDQLDILIHSGTHKVSFDKGRKIHSSDRLRISLAPGMSIL